jgi:hypothetical protein
MIGCRLNRIAEENAKEMELHDMWLVFASAALLLYMLYLPVRDFIYLPLRDFFTVPTFFEDIPEAAPTHEASNQPSASQSAPPAAPSAQSAPQATPVYPFGIRAERGPEGYYTTRIGTFSITWLFRHWVFEEDNCVFIPHNLVSHPQWTEDSRPALPPYETFRLPTYESACGLLPPPYAQHTET